MDPHVKEKPAIGVFTAGTDLIVRVWDDALASMTGLAAADAIGKPITELIPEVRERGLLSRFEFVRDFGTTEVLAPALHRYLIPCPPRVPSSSFSHMRQLVTISALYSDERIEGLIVVVEDVTERMEQEKMLAERLKDPDDTVRLKAAKEISGRSGVLHSPDAKPVIDALADRNWRVRRTLVAGLAKRSAPDAVAALLEAVREEHLDFGVLNGALQVLQATAIDTTATLLEFLRSDDHDLRMQAALALGHQNNRIAIEPLLETLDDEDANVRYHAIEALGNLRASEAVEPLMAIAESRDFFLSFAALDALKQIGDPSVAARVSLLLDDDLLREAATSTLGATGGVDAAEPIVRMLNEGTVSVSAASDALCALFERHAASEGTPNPLAERVRQIIQPSGVAALLEAIDTDSKATKSAVCVAGWIKSEEAVPKLVALLDREELRETVLAALVDQGEAAIPALIDNLKSEDEAIRADVARALGSIGGDGGIEALVTALHSDTSIAPAILDALGSSASKQANDALIELLRSPNTAVRRAAVTTLGRFRPAGVKERLFGLLTDDDPNAREATIRVIGGLRTSESNEAVVEACRDENEVVRAAAVEQLASLPPDEAVKLLSASLNDPSSRVRGAAAQTLANFENDAAVRALHSALGDSDAWVRYFAIRSLSANVRRPQSVDLLRQMAEADPAEHVRMAAAEAIDGVQA